MVLREVFRVQWTTEETRRRGRELPQVDADGRDPTEADGVEQVVQEAERD